MPYHIYKSGRSSSRLVHESWKEGKRQRRSIPKSEWAALGLSPLEPPERLKVRISHLNSIEGAGAKEQRARLRLVKDAALTSVYLPADYVKEFENDLLSSDRRFKPAHWEAAKRAIVAVGMHPKDWKFRRRLFYEWMRHKDRRYSPDYCADIIRMLNMWGEYLCYRTGSFWSAIPYLRGTELTAVRRAYFEKSGGGRDSARLSLLALERGGKKIPPAEHNWLYVAVAFGLRPEEIDKSLSDPRYHRLEENCIRVFQFKLERLGYKWKECWKAITIELPHQRAALELLLRKDPLKRPGRKALKDWFGKRMGYYGGRKEFAPYMREQGFSEYQVMRWMGHQDLGTLRKNYDKADSDAPEAM